ncbi:MAG TPA: transglycosylase SLT domain-containing protein [Blastocatellia bacterium]|nr:transglycosylase SLT domain-containing protein [Blastocatellia bacterium]
MLKRLKLISLVSSAQRRNGRRDYADILRNLCLLCVSAVSVVLFGASGSAGAQNLQSKANDIRAAVDSREFERAESLVRELRADDPAAFTRNNYDYLLGRLLERRGVRSEASALYLSCLERNSVVAQYALWHLAVLARDSGDLALERQYITRLLLSYSSSALAPRARERLIDSNLESGENRAAIALLKPTATTTGTKGRSAMARLGEAYSKTGDAESARGVFNQLIGSRDDYALAAAIGLDALDKASGVRPNEFDALRRARIYLFNRHWTEARAHLLDIVERFPESPNRSEALYQTGFSLFREYNYPEAIKWFERAHTEFPEKKDGEQGYYYVGSSLQQARRYEEAAKRYADFTTEYPESELLEGAYRNVVDCLRYAGKFEEAVEWSRRIVQRFAGQPLATVGLYNEAKIELTRGRYESAHNLLTRVSALPVTAKVISAPIRGEAAFLKIFALEKMGRVAEAARAYLAIADERDNYFGQRATERLRALMATDEGRRVLEPLGRAYRTQARAAFDGGRYAEAKDAANQALRLIEEDAARSELLGILRKCYTHLPAYAAAARYRLIPVAREVITQSKPTQSEPTHQALAAEFMFLGLYDEGVTELADAGLTGNSAASARNTTRASAASQPNGDAAYSMAVYSNRGDQAYRAIAFGESAAKSIPQDYRLELMPRDLVELIYPAPYRDAFDRYSPPAKVDPRLVLSLARQESRFNPSVKSAASARGLLQFIPETAQKLADEEGLKDFDLDDVYAPEVAVRLAVRYVADLLKLFPENPHAVLAAYNTGELNVERWISRARSNDVDRLVSEIAIPETKDYVAKVMNSYRAYSVLYTRELKPRTR